MSNITSRVNLILEKRRRKLELNRLAYLGGEDYVRARLWRAPNESMLSWEGRSFSQGYGDWSTGRRDRAVCHREGGRIADKINQYIFSVPVDRQGVAPDFERVASVDGRSLAEVWQEVSTAITLCGWCWVAIRKPAAPEGATLADVERLGLGPKLAVLFPWEVPDWSFDGTGNLRWAITEATEVRSDDPRVEAKEVKIRTLWERVDGEVRWTSYENDTEVANGVFGRGVAIPLLCVGRITGDPWWFDEVESEQAQLMNLASLHAENLSRTVYPQLILAAGAVDAVESRLVERAGGSGGEGVVEIIKELVRSADTPIVESGEDKGVTRYIQPNASDLNAIPDSIARERAALFDRVGLALFNREQRQIQTAESKAFDHLDTSATLRQRAELLEDAEKRAVALMTGMDGFSAYEPKWNRDFDVSDTTGDAQALVQVGNLPGLTLTQRKVLLKAATEVLGSIAPIGEEDRKSIDEEIAQLKDEPDIPIPTV